MEGIHRIDHPPGGNHLFPILLLFFVCIHAAGWAYYGHRLHEPEADYIELDLNQVYQPAYRKVPRPQAFPTPASDKIPPLPKPISPPRYSQARTPRAVKPDTPPPADLSVPTAADLPAPSILPYLAGRQVSVPREEILADYFNVVRAKIDAHKVYPDSARKRRAQGAVVVRFVVAADGHVTSVEVIGGTGSDTLRQAAAEAVRHAFPFPGLPAALGKASIPIQLTIRFRID